MYNSKGFKKKKSLIRRILRFFVLLFLFCIVFPIIQVVVLKFVDPPVSMMMMYKFCENLIDSKPISFKHENVNYEDINPTLFQAIVAGEDQRFFEHSGFDLVEIDKAMAEQKKHKKKKIRGASTLTQQTAKNLFLIPTRSFVRKGIEAYYTILMEIFWSKKRIIEIYANIVEFGPNIYGAEAASMYHFKKHAKKLYTWQSARLAAVLPNPIRWSASKPSNYIRLRTNWIVSQMVALPSEMRE